MTTGPLVYFNQPLCEQNKLVSYIQGSPLNRLLFGFLIGLISGLISFVIVSFQPVELKTRLVIMLTIGLSDWAATYFCLEMTMGRLGQKITFFAEKKVYKVYLLTFLIFTITQVLISLNMSFTLKLLSEFDFSYYVSNPTLYRPFSLEHSAKLIPVWLAFTLVITDLALRPSKVERASPQIKREGISIQTDKGLRWLDFGQLSHISAEEHYLRFHLPQQGEELVVKMTLSSAIKQLPEGPFAQPHRSYLVNLGYFDRMEYEQGAWKLFLSGVKEPLNVSRRRQKEFKETLAQFHRSL